MLDMFGLALWRWIYEYPAACNLDITCHNTHLSKAIYQVTADVRFSNVDKISNVYKSSNGAYLNLATVLEPQNIGFEAL